MPHLTYEKLVQASDLVAASDLDVWLTFVRETVEGGDPVLPLILEGGLTWQSALLVGRKGERVAIVGNYDADALIATRDWTKVVPYVQSVKEPLLAELESMVPTGKRPRIGVNFSADDVKSDGLSHGMYLLLESYLKGTRFEGSLVGADQVAGRLRSQKTPEELRRIKRAIEETDILFEKIASFAKPGVTEAEVQRLVHREIDRSGFGYGWDRTGNPIVNSGPDSMVGHGTPSETIKIAPGHIFHVDLGVVVEGYSSDIQRCWYMPMDNETDLPADVQQALDAVAGAITAGSALLKPGVQGRQVDEAGRTFLVSKGYPEYMHAFGHQVGRMAHDGGAILGPRWERYGNTPMMPIEAGEVYTAELGVMVDGRGYLGLEEMVLVTETGVEWLTKRQMDMPLLG